MEKKEILRLCLLKLTESKIIKMAKILDLKKKTNNQIENDMKKKIKSTQKRMYVLSGIFFSIPLIFYFYKFIKSHSENDLEKEIFQAVFSFEDGEYEKALVGDGNFLGFSDILKKYKGSNLKKLNIIKYYTGISFMKTGNFDQAIDNFMQVKFDDLIMQSLLYGLIGDCFCEKSDFEKSNSFYKKASEININDYTTPIFLLKIAINYETLNEKSLAISIYKEIREKYPNFKKSLTLYKVENI